MRKTIKTGIIFFYDGISFRYRHPFKPDRILGALGTPLNVLFKRLGNIPGVQKRIFCFPDSIAPSLVEEARSLKLILAPFSLAEVVEKPFSHSEERWQVFPDRGSDSWLGNVFAEVVKKHGLTQLVIVSLANLFVDGKGIQESLTLQMREKFDVTWSEDRLPGANWVILSADLLMGLEKSHPDLMKTRGGLTWMLRKPLYPFKVGEHHSPRVNSLFHANLSLNNERVSKVVCEVVWPDFSLPDFSYESWIKDSRWINKFCDFGPISTAMELTNNCSGGCYACPQPKLSREKGFMPVKVFKKVFASIPQANWSFAGMGEPFLHPEISSFAQMLEKSHLTIHTSLLCEPPEDFSWKNFDLVRISVDALDRAMFENLRPGCSWEHIEAFLQKSEIRKKDDPHGEPEIGISLLRHNKNAIMTMDFLRYWRQICTPAFRTDFFLWPLNETPQKVQWYQIIGNSDFLGKIPREFDVSYTPINRRLCHHAMTKLHILWDGRVSICPYDFDGNFILGDLSQSSPLEIWNSEKATLFRQQHISNDFSEEFPCRKCQDWYHKEG